MRTRRMKRLAAAAGLDESDDNDDNDVNDDNASKKAFENQDVSFQILSNELMLTATDTTDIASLSLSYSDDAIVGDAVIDIDAFTDDPTFASMYVQRMYYQLKSYEIEFKIQDYFKTQIFISHKLRGKCVDFIIQMCFEINARSETLYATIALMDRYLSLSSDIKAPQLILLALSCLMICYKFEEVYFNIYNALRIAENLITLLKLGENIILTKERMVKTEALILETVEWKLFHPNAYTFVVRYLHVSDEELNHNTTIDNRYDSHKTMIHDLTCCISDRILVESSLLRFLPSQLAAAALYIARSKSAVYGIKDWTNTLSFYTGKIIFIIFIITSSIHILGYSKSDLDPVVYDIIKVFQLEVDMRTHHEKMKQVFHINVITAENNSKANILNGCRDKHGDETYEIVVNSY